MRLFISDKCLGLVESLGEFFLEADWQRCTVHFYRNVFSVVPHQKILLVAAMLKAIHSQEDKEAAREKAVLVEEKLKAMKLQKAAELLHGGIGETLMYMSYPREHWRKIRTNNPMERIRREIRRRTRVVGNFPDGTSELMLVTARLRYIAGQTWGTRMYMNMRLLGDSLAEKELLEA